MSFIDPEGLMFGLVDALRGCIGQVLFPYNSCIKLNLTPEFLEQRAKLQVMTKALRASFNKMFEEEAHAILENDPI